MRLKRAIFPGASAAIGLACSIYWACEATDAYSEADKARVQAEIVETHGRPTDILPDYDDPYITKGHEDVMLALVSLAFSVMYGGLAVVVVREDQDRKKTQQVEGLEQLDISLDELLDSEGL